MKTAVALFTITVFFFGFAALEKQEGRCIRQKIPYRTHEIKQFDPPKTLWVKANEVEACNKILLLYDNGKLVFEDSINHFEIVK